MADGNFHSGSVLLLKWEGSPAPVLSSPPPPRATAVRHAATVGKSPTIARARTQARARTHPTVLLQFAANSCIFVKSFKFFAATLLRLSARSGFPMPRFCFRLGCLWGFFFLLQKIHSSFVLWEEQPCAGALPCRVLPGCSSAQTRVFIDSMA